MSSKNKFGFAPVEAPTSGSRRNRQPGPMGAAVRDVAENLQEATEAKIEQRRRNAEDAKTFRQAQGEGRVLYQIDLSEISSISSDWATSSSARRSRGRSSVKISDRSVSYTHLTLPTICSV